MIVLATNNVNKLKEFRSLFPKEQILSLKEIGFQDEIKETGKTFRENALMKAKQVSEKMNCLTISDDSGLEVEALNGQPGVHSARYASDHNEELNNRKLIRKLQGKTNRKAKYVCAICVYHPDGTYRIFEGECEGIIIDEAKGNQGFGYDPHFYVPELHHTFAEISLEEKNRFSHRAKAIRNMLEVYDENFGIK